MTDTQAPLPGAPSRVRLWIILGLTGLAVAIAAWVWLGNAGQAKECPVQAEDAAAIGDAATGELAALNGTGEGRGYATMAFKDAAGKDMTIADFKGKALLVNFWASWCVPCREEMPALDALATKYNSDAFMVLPINLDIGEGGLVAGEKAPAGKMRIHDAQGFVAAVFPFFEQVLFQLPSALLQVQPEARLANEWIV